MQQFNEQDWETDRNRLIGAAIIAGVSLVMVSAAWVMSDPPSIAVEQELQALVEDARKG